MQQTTYAPRQLPIAPRPVAGELVSSWLSRVAAAKYLSLDERIRNIEILQPPTYQCLMRCSNVRRKHCHPLIEPVTGWLEPILTLSAAVMKQRV